MTDNEFLALKRHARIKYIGTRPAEDLFKPRHDPTCKTKTPENIAGCSSGYRYNSNCTNGSTMPKSFVKKGVVVQYASRDTWRNPAGEYTLSYYGGLLRSLNPAEWELVDARKWVEGETEYKMAKSYVPQVARKFKAETKSFLETYKRRIDYKLENLPLDKKLKLIMELNPEDKKWFGILNSDPDEVITLIEKAFENNDL